jgi:glycosyltransferase involved in cell wall biosynthesis
MRLSVVIPTYNEALSLPELITVLRRTLDPLDLDYELLFIDDGSCDGSREVLRQFAASDQRVRVLAFSRNFGHQAAITSGLDFAEGDAVVVMDADLQDPPDLLPSMLNLFHEGYDVVSAQRVRREGDSLFKRMTARWFYWFMQTMVDKRIVPEVGDFRLFSREAVLLLRNFREQHRFMRGLVAWLGLKEAIVALERSPRHAGKTNYSLVRMAGLAWTAVCSFSALPLRLSLAAGFVLSSGAFAYFVFAAYAALVTKHVVPGWTSLVSLLCLFFGFIFIALGMIGDYLARIYEEAKGRPLYVIGGFDNIEAEALTRPRAAVLAQRRPQKTAKEATREP